MKEKLKVVWLCNLSNKEIQNAIRSHKRVNEYAPWMFMSLKIAEKDSRFEFHVIAPHTFIMGVKEFELRGIHYHFFNPYIPIWGHPWPYFFEVNYMTNFCKTKRIVSRIVESIKPDIIHLFGAENPEYSSAILPLAKKYPTVLSIQGFFSHSKNANSKNDKKRMDIEQEIIRAIPVCFSRSKTQAKDVLEYNHNMQFIPNSFGSCEIKYDDLPKEKKYDLVFFARICKDKGVDDLLQVVFSLKKRLPNISLCIIGGGNTGGYKEKCKEMGIDENVVWTGFLPTRKDVHFTAAQGRISVLPTYHDVLPGTIIESMFMGIPMVTYDVDSNPEINENYEAIKLVKVGDVNALTETLFELLQNEKERIELSEAGKKRAYEMFAPSDKQVADQWMNGYEFAVSLFNKKVTQK